MLAGMLAFTNISLNNNSYMGGGLFVLRVFLGGVFVLFLKYTLSPNYSTF